MKKNYLISVGFLSLAIYPSFTYSMPCLPNTSHLSTQDCLCRPAEDFQGCYFKRELLENLYLSKLSSGIKDLVIEKIDQKLEEKKTIVFNGDFFIGEILEEASERNINFDTNYKELASILFGVKIIDTNKGLKLSDISVNVNAKSTFDSQNNKKSSVKITARAKVGKVKIHGSLSHKNNHRGNHETTISGDVTWKP